MDNPRSAETLVEEFTVDTSDARDQLGWQPDHTGEDSIRGLLRANAADSNAHEQVDQSI